MERRDTPARQSQRGIALVTVLIAIAIILVLTNQFGTTTSTDMIAAGNYRDQMRAHFLARSAQNLGELVVHIQETVESLTKSNGAIQITDFADQLILPFCGGGEEVRDMIGVSADQVPGLGAEIGTCGFNGPFTTEDDKINVNCAMDVNLGKNIAVALELLMFPAAYDPVFEEADAEEWRRDRKTQASAILDYVDKDSGRFGQIGAGEDYGYENLRDRYQPKNNKIDTIGEIKLVRGVDDRFWTLFGTSLTVYGGCRINVTSLSNPQLIVMLLQAAGEPNDPVLQDPQKLFLLASVIAKARQFGETFTKADDFIKFVEDPSAAISALSGTGGVTGAAAQNAAANNLGIPPGMKLGMKLKKAELDKIAIFGARRTYRIEAYGEIVRQQKNADGSPVFPPIRKTINGVFDIKGTRQNVRRSNAPTGAWLFLRED